MNVTPKQTIGRRLKTAAIVAVVLLIYLWAFSTFFAHFTIKPTALQTAKFIFGGMMHPDRDYISDPGGEDLLHALLETFNIAILGTFISAALCVPFAFWGARNMSRYRLVSSSGKVFLSAIRVFPELIMALLFIKAVGLGPFAGVLALGFHSIGMLGKLFGESIEDMNFAAREALQACGGNRLQTLWFAIVPQILPQFFSYTLYRFEISVRSASILGMVGAGGIGAPLIFALNAHRWDRVSIILIGIIVMVSIIDLVSGAIRKRLV